MSFLRETSSCISLPFVLQPVLYFATDTFYSLTISFEVTNNQ